MEWDFLLKWPD